MPFTPFHFGPHACIGLAFYRRIDLPAFMLANVAVDIEPLLVMQFNLNYPLHGYCHTFLIGPVVGILFAVFAWFLRDFLMRFMAFIRLPYETGFWKIIISAVLGVWLHVLFDAPLYTDIRPFYPFTSNPLFGLFSIQTVYNFCVICFLPALIIYLYLAIRNIKINE